MAGVIFNAPMMITIVRFSLRFFFIISLLQWISCVHPKPEVNKFYSITDTITNASFKNANIKFAGLGIANGGFGELEVIDTFLLVADFTDSSLLHIFNLNSRKELKFFLKRGDGKGECLNIASIVKTPDKNKFWIYDITLGKFLRINLSRALADTAYLPEEEFTLKEMCRAARSPCWINDSLFAACSYNLEDCRYFYFDKNSVIKKKVGELPPPAWDWPNDTHKTLSLLASAYIANLVARPSGDAFVASYINSSKIEFYKEGRLKKIVRGPDIISPIFSFPDRIYMTSPEQDKNTWFANMQIKGDNKFVYVLYSGRNNFQTYGKQLMVFDWEGNPVKNIPLASECYYLAVHDNNEEITLYMLDKNTMEIISGTLKI